MLARIACHAIRFYQRHISRRIGANCPYEPSCSAYGLLAYQRFGFFWGSLLTAWRLLRCNPCTGGGRDDVPARRDGRPDRAI